MIALEAPPGADTRACYPPDPWLAKVRRRIARGAVAELRELGLAVEARELEALLVERGPRAELALARGLWTAAEDLEHEERARRLGFSARRRARERAARREARLWRSA